MAAQECWITPPPSPHTERVTHVTCAHADKLLGIKDESARNDGAEITPDVSHISLMGARRTTWCHLGWLGHIWETPAANSRPHIITFAPELLWCDIHTPSSRWSVQVLLSSMVELLKAFLLPSEEVWRRQSCCVSWAANKFTVAAWWRKVATENYWVLSTSRRKAQGLFYNYYTIKEK